MLCRLCYAGQVSGIAAYDPTDPPAGHERAHKRTQKRRRAKRYQILPDCIHHPPTAFKKHAEDTRLIQSVLAAIASM